MHDPDPMQTTGTAENPSPGTSSVLRGETGTKAEQRDGTAYTSASDATENENGEDETSPLDELDDAVAGADDTGMVAQQQFLSELAEQPPLQDT